MFGINKLKMNLISGIGNREIIGVDFSSNNIKLAHIKILPNKKELVNLVCCDINGLSDADIYKIMRSRFGELAARNPEVVNILPPNLVITKNIEIPSTDELEIREIVNLQAGRHTPYSREEIIVDYINIGTYKNSYTKILLVIVARSAIKRQLDILEKAGIKADRVFLSSEAIAWSASRFFKLETQDAPVSIVHIDESASDFTVVFKNRALFIRSIPIGVFNLLSEKEKYFSRFMEELKRSLEAYQSEDIDKSPQQLILTGAIDELRELEEVLNNTLHVPSRIVPYLKNVAVSDKAAQVVSAKKRISFFGVVAPLLACDEMKVNLVPEEVKLRKSLQDRGKDLIKTGILVMTVFVLGFSIVISKIYFKSARLGVLNKKYQALNQEAQKLEKDFLKVGLIKNYLSSRGYSLELLTELYNLAPLELQLADIRFDEQGKFSVRGTAESMSIVFSFVESMGKSRYFKDVKTKYTTKRKEDSKDVADFEITASLRREND